MLTKHEKYEKDARETLGKLTELTQKETPLGTEWVLKNPPKTRADAPVLHRDAPPPRIRVPLARVTFLRTRAAEVVVKVTAAQELTSELLCRAKANRDVTELKNIAQALRLNKRTLEGQTLLYHSALVEATSDERTLLKSDINAVETAEREANIATLKLILSLHKEVDQGHDQKRIAAHNGNVMRYKEEIEAKLLEPIGIYTSEELNGVLERSATEERAEEKTRAAPRQATRELCKTPREALDLLNPVIEGADQLTRRLNTDPQFQAAVMASVEQVTPTVLRQLANLIEVFKEPGEELNLDELKVEVMGNIESNNADANKKILEKTLRILEALKSEKDSGASSSVVGKEESRSFRAKANQDIQNVLCRQRIEDQKEHILEQLYTLHGSQAPRMTVLMTELLPLIYDAKGATHHGGVQALREFDQYLREQPNDRKIHNVSDVDGTKETKTAIEIMQHWKSYVEQEANTDPGRLRGRQHVESMDPPLVQPQYGRPDMSQMLRTLLRMATSSESSDQALPSALEVVGSELERFIITGESPESGGEAGSVNDEVGLPPR